MEGRIASTTIAIVAGNLVFVVCRYAPAYAKASARLNLSLVVAQRAKTGCCLRPSHGSHALRVHSFV